MYPQRRIKHTRYQLLGCPQKAAYSNRKVAVCIDFKQAIEAKKWPRLITRSQLVPNSNWQSTSAPHARGQAARATHHSRHATHHFIHAAAFELFHHFAHLFMLLKQTVKILDIEPRTLSNAALT